MMTFGIGIRGKPSSYAGQGYCFLLAMDGFYDQELSYGDLSITQYLYLYAMSNKQYQK